jgi:hypothetical protein
MPYATFLTNRTGEGSPNFILLYPLLYYLAFQCLNSWHVRMISRSHLTKGQAGPMCGMDTHIEYLPNVSLGDGQNQFEIPGARRGSTRERCPVDYRLFSVGGPYGSMVMLTNPQHRSTSPFLLSPIQCHRMTLRPPSPT